MPWVTINMLEGRSVEMKEKLHMAVSKAVSDSLGVPLDRVHVQLVDMPAEGYSVGGKRLK